MLLAICIMLSGSGGAATASGSTRPDLVPFRDRPMLRQCRYLQPDRYPESMKMLDEKMGNIREARPDIIATGNPGCLIQLALGVRRTGLEAEVVHPIGLLERAYRLGNQ
jgi:hypothetical protein